MSLEGELVRRACRDSVVVEGRQFCRAELDRFRKIVQSGDPVTVACTHQAPLFQDAANETEDPAPLTFVNIRETAGWSKEARGAGAKIAALIAASAEPMPETPFVSLTSDGVVLLYGIDEQVLEAAHLLKDHLDVTVLLKPGAEVLPARIAEFPVVKGTIVAAKGHLGAFELTVDDYAAPKPSSRDALQFEYPRMGAISRCDIILDISGGPSLFTAGDLRDGYLRADPRDPAAVLRAVVKARDLSGTFDKPRYVNFAADLCAHSRSRLVGCHRCLDVCPTGAIAPAGDHVAIDPYVCAGCGQCAAVCPTGAASYSLPPSDAMVRKLRTLISAFRHAGGENAIVMFHDAEHGGNLIDALARYGDGLPANVLPVEVNEVTQVGLESIAAAIAYGASAVRVLLRSKPRHDVAGLYNTVALAEPILTGLGFGSARLSTIETDDPDVLGRVLRDIEPMQGTANPATFAATGRKREMLRLALRELHAAAPAPTDIIPLPPGAPFGAIEVTVDGCTLCLSCVSACPTGALSDDPDRPMLRFAEDACVQCGLCKATCPEKVISLKPQIDFRAATSASRIIKQEEPAECIRCGKPFGVKSSVERVVAKLEGKHWMYKDSKKRIDVIRMCEDCRVTAMAEENFDPFGSPPRPRVRTTEDYLRERDEKGGAET
ncbi:MAG TPA: 4Fe-4S binding protein [Pseudolabrys sp.]|nr:4Fe-4S binding protein [Pseudolabrys sp.]